MSDIFTKLFFSTYNEIFRGRERTRLLLRSHRVAPEKTATHWMVMRAVPS